MSVLQAFFSALSPLELAAYGMSLMSLWLLGSRRYISGYLVGCLDVIPWVLLALGKFDSPGLLFVEAVYLVFNLRGLVKALKGTPIHEPVQG